MNSYILPTAHGYQQVQVHVKEGSDVILGATIVAPSAGDMV
jgi:hypothetical protein